MSENLRKLIGVVVMAVLVVVGVVVSSGDDTDYTRNVSFRDNPERLEGGDRLEDPDCCDQNAYEILKLQNQYAALEEQLGKVAKVLSETEGSLAAAEETIEQLQEESCSSVGKTNEGYSDSADWIASRCAYIGHKEMVVPVDNVSALWIKESSGSKSCRVGEGIVNWGLGWLSDEIGIDAGTVDLCSSTWVTKPANEKAPIKSHVMDKYLLFTLSCPNVANFVPKDHKLYNHGYADPLVWMQQSDASKAKYWVAPQSESAHQDGTWQLGITAANIGAKKEWGSGAPQYLAAWTFDREAMDIYGNSKDDSFATRGVTVIIEDLETGEHHYAYVTASVGYRVLADGKKQLQEGTAKGRCESDITLIRSYS